MDTRTQAIIAAFAEQRDNMADTVCAYAGEVAVLKERLDAALKRIEELKPKDVPVLKEVA